ncbi:MAG: gliding motility-associated C-terminal domain-containing protein [Flavisolibacter sp.]
MKRFLPAICLLLQGFMLNAQTVCTTPGQNPGTAFPVCGTGTFSQASVPICGGTRVPSPTCNTYPLTDVNPFWYKFTCYQAGTLGFKITPNTNSEDYDWQVFDITNRNPTDVYNDVSLSIASNWSGEGGETGASPAGSQLFVCEGLGKPLWSKMPNLVLGHEYIILVSHFTQTQSGYKITFSGGSAVITDTTQPKMKTAEASCGGDVVRLKLNKKVKCSSLTAAGTEFYITPGNIPVASANGFGCSTGFDTDSILVNVGTFLSPGNYVLNIRQGSDGNTVLDYCDNAIPITDKVPFTVYPLVPTPMDSLSPVKCKPNTLKLVFRKPMLCSTVASDGSDFTISGNYPVTISGATGSCTNGSLISKEVVITLSRPLYNNGTFTFTLKDGSDGNTIRDECGQETPAGSFLVFSVKDTVNASFTYSKLYGCINDTINFFHSGNNGVNSWQWSLDDNKTSSLQQPVGLYQLFNQKNISLIVSNGFCSDTASQTILLDNFLKADFNNFDDVCPNEATTFTSTAQGKIVSHNWTFGDGGVAVIASPSHVYSGPLVTTPRIVSYTVTDSLGCKNSIEKTVKVYSSCYLAVPTGFTPNHDGRNDFFGPLNAIKAEKLDFRVYNRWGQLVYQTNNWKQGWDGTMKGSPQETGVYVWFLSFTDRDTKEKRQMKGTVTLIR